MGSRVSWCAKDQRGRLDVYFRQQWIGSIEKYIVATYQHLGEFANRFDLGTGRIMNSLIAVANDKGSDVTGHIWDSSDNGLIEIDCSNPDKWIIKQYDIGFEDQKISSKGKTIAEMTKDGFRWLKTEEELLNIGEGIS